VPTINLGASGFRAPYPTYHVTKDDLAIITPEILEDAAQLLYMAVLDMANQDSLNFRK
jgi:aminopeptidase-like protein